MLYLDGTRKDSGALRVIPGSHRMPLHGEIEPERRHQRGETVDPFADRPGDDEEISYVRLKTMLYLDGTRKDSGALRVIPGSHRMPLHGEIEPERRHQRGETVDPFGVRGEDVPCFPVESNPGDLVFFCQSLWHSVFHGWVGRRYIALKYAPVPTADKQIASLCHYTKGSIFEPPEFFASSDNPRARHMVDPLPELGRRKVPDFVPVFPDY